jgi:hypothetical protein
MKRNRQQQKEDPSTTTFLLSTALSTKSVHILLVERNITVELQSRCVGAGVGLFVVWRGSCTLCFIR